VANSTYSIVLPELQPCLDRKYRILSIPVRVHPERKRLKTIEFLVLRFHNSILLQSLADLLNLFGTGAFALRQYPGEVPTISRKLLLKAGWSVNPVSNATLSKDLSVYSNSDFAA
jgi:hypothetical protein